jgi:hypothetical protein
MPKKIFLSDLDLSLNQLLQAKLENLAADPANSESRLYYNTAIKKIKYYNGTVWLTVIDDLDTRLTNARTPSAHVIATNVGLGAEHTISGAAAGMVLRASGATAANFQQLLHGDLGNVGTNTHAQIDTHIADATKHRVINDAGTTTTDLFSASRILQLIADVNSAVVGSLVFKGGYDAATNVPDLDTAPSATIKQGWTYVATTAGAFFAENVEAGDLIIAKQDAPTTLAHYTVVNKNIPAILSATTVVEGLMFLATQAEVNAGTDATKAVTSVTLQAKLGLSGTQTVVRRESAIIGDGAATSYVINHGLASRNITVRIHRNSAPYDEVETEVQKTTTGSITVLFSVAPSASQYVVTLNG